MKSDRTGKTWIRSLYFLKNMQLNLNIAGIGQMELCVNEYPVAGF